MKVYVSTSEPFHDNSTLVGVFDTLEAAKAACQPIYCQPGAPSLEWNEKGVGVWIANISEHVKARGAPPEHFQIKLVEIGLVLGYDRTVVQWSV